MESNEEIAEEVIQENVPDKEQSGKFVPDEKDYMPRKKYDEVYGQMESVKTKLGKYSVFGDADEVQSKLDRLNSYEDRIKEFREQQSLTQEQRDVQQNNEQIRKQMEEIYPELKNLGRISEIDELRGYREDQILGQASDYLGSVLKSNELSVDADTQGDIEDFLLSKMTANEREAMSQGDFGVIDSVYERVKGSRLMSSLTGETPQNESRPPQKAPMRHKSGGAGAQKENKKPMSMREAEDLGWARMEAGKNA